MARIISFRLTEVDRGRLAIVLTILASINILVSLVLVATGAYIEVSVQKNVNLIKGYNGYYLPGLIIGTGCLSVIAGIAAGKMASDSKDIKGRKKLRPRFLAYIYSVMALYLLVSVVGILCYAHIANLHVAFAHGIELAMLHYKDDSRLKEQIDTLQMEYSCCGSENYADWFSIPWTDHSGQAGIGSLGRDGSQLHDDVPFSCCDYHSSRPCIDRHVQQNNRHFNYDFRVHTTLNEKGCRDALMDYYGDTLLVNVGGLIFGIAIIQLISLVISRFLQTSCRASLKTLNNNGTASGWLIDLACCAKEAKQEESSLLEHSDEDSSLYRDLDDVNHIWDHDDGDHGFATSEFDEDEREDDENMALAGETYYDAPRTPSLGTIVAKRASSHMSPPPTQNLEQEFYDEADLPTYYHSPPAKRYPSSSTAATVPPPPPPPPPLMHTGSRKYLNKAVNGLGHHRSNHSSSSLRHSASRSDKDIYQNIPLH